jgi:hypothetical protein
MIKHKHARAHTQTHTNTHRCHPDRAPPEKKEAAERDFKALKEAYDVLVDPQKRHIYDTQVCADNYIHYDHAWYGYGCIQVCLYTYMYTCIYTGVKLR